MTFLTRTGMLTSWRLKLVAAAALTQTLAAMGHNILVFFKDFRFLLCFHNFVIAVAMLIKTCASLRFQDNLSLGCCLLALWMHFWVSGALQGSILGVPRVQELHFGSLGAAVWMFWGHFGSSGGLLGAMVGSSWPRLATWEPTLDFS